MYSCNIVMYTVAVGDGRPRHGRQAMPRALTVYTPRGDVLELPDDLTTALGLPEDSRDVGVVLVWALDPTHAALLLDQVGLTPSPVELVVANTLWAGMLHRAGDWPEGTVLVTRLVGDSPLVSVTRDPTPSTVLPRACRVVGWRETDTTLVRLRQPTAGVAQVRAASRSLPPVLRSLVRPWLGRAVTAALRTGA